MPLAPKAMLQSSLPNPITALTTPHKLPKLLSILPQNGLHAIIQPAHGRSPNFYLVTRSKLRYKTVRPRDPEDKPVGRDGVPLARGHRVPWVEVDPMELGEGSKGQLKVAGGCWVMRFKNGHYQPPLHKSALPDQKLQHISQMSWTAVDPKAVPEPTRTALGNWREAYAKHLKLRQEELVRKKAANEIVSREKVKEAKRVRDNLLAWKLEDRKVRILY